MLIWMRSRVRLKSGDKLRTHQRHYQGHEVGEDSQKIYDIHDSLDKPWQNLFKTDIIILNQLDLHPLLRSCNKPYDVLECEPTYKDSLRHLKEILFLRRVESRNGGEDKTKRWDDDEEAGDDGHDLRCWRVMRILKKIPEMSLVPSTEAITKVVKALILLDQVLNWSLSSDQWGWLPCWCV